MSLSVRCGRRIHLPTAVRMPKGRRGAISLIAVALAAGGALGSAFPATALWTSAYHSNLYNYSGSAYVSNMTVVNDIDDWYSCDSDNCWTVANYVRVDWSLTGSNAFTGIFGSSYGYGDLCSTMHNYKIVNAGPSNPTGSDYVYFPPPTDPTCLIGLGQYWDWAGGMCNNSGQCANYLQASLGPFISWDWVPPTSSATNFDYYW